MTNPTAFYLVTTGLDLCNSATTGIPSIRVARFKLGSQHGYDVSPTDTDIRGTTVYEGDVLSVTQYSHDTIRVTVQLASSLGPFTFGEVGLFTDTGVLFALCSYPTMQTKLEPVTSGIANPWTISALLQVTQGSGIFFLSNAVLPSIPEFPDFTYVTSPSATVGNPNAILVHEAVADNQPVLLVASGDDWMPMDWTQVAVIAPSYVADDTLQFSGAEQLDGNTPGRYMIGSGKGDFVPIQSIYQGIAHLPRVETWLSSTEEYFLYEKSSYRAGLSVLSVAESNAMIAQLNKVWGAATGNAVAVPTKFGTADSLLPYFGYGQQALSNITDPNDPISWSGFIEALVACADVLNIPVDVDLTGFSGKFLNTTRGSAQLAVIRKLLAQVTERRLHIPLNRLETQIGITQRGSTNNKYRIHLDVTATFASVPEMYAYFNSGGSVCFLLEDGDADVPGQTYAQYWLKYTLSQLGTIRFSGLSCESLGQIKVKGRGTFPLSPMGTGYQGSRNPAPSYSSDSILGFYSLSPGLRAEVFSYVAPLGTDGSSTATAMIAEIGIYATRVGNTVKLECWVNVMAYSDYMAGTLTASTPRQTAATVYLARASSSFMSVNYPSVTYDYTNW